MKKKIVLFIFLLITCINIISKSQNLTGEYNVSGYFFYASSPRNISLTKNITRVGDDTYQIDFLGDVPSYGFQFTVDANNHLTNWVATGNTSPAPASGFITTDNPGGFIYDGPPYPGSPPWVQSTYNNTYDPATRTFYMHYGTGPGAADQNGYNIQIYEKYVLNASAKITSVIPLSGTSFTQVTINGKNLSLVDPAAYSVYFGNTVADTAWVDSDKKLIAKVGSGASGNVSVTDVSFSTSTFPGFVYTPVPPVTNKGWGYLGKAGFSQNRVYYVSACSGSNNIPYVAFVDSGSYKTKVMKFSNNKWSGVGPAVSAGKSIYTDIVLTKNNTPIVAFVDSTVGGKLKVKKLSGGDWITLGSEVFISTSENNQSPYSLAVDSNDIPYVASTSHDSVNVYKFQNNKWTRLGKKNFAVASYYSGVNIAISKSSNTPYIIFEDNITNQALVMKYDGSAWTTVGSAITNGRNGAFYPDVEIDNLGNPFASMQDDNGFERQSVYKFKNGAWTPAGSPRFTKSRAYYNSFAIDNKNNPYVLFQDFSYNKSGTVMKLNRNSNTWDTIGRRGFINFSGLFERHSIIFDTTNVPMVAFSDLDHGGKISVLKLRKASNSIDEEQSSAVNTIAKTTAGFTLFPNPVHSVLNIRLNSVSANSLIEIVNTKGLIVLQKQISAVNYESPVSIDVSKLAAGAYICSVKTGNELLSSRFLKQ